MPIIQTNGRLLFDEAKQLYDNLAMARMLPNRLPQYTPDRLESAVERAGRRYERRWLKYGGRPNRKGRASTQDRPYAVGGRGRRGW